MVSEHNIDTVQMHFLIVLFHDIPGLSKDIRCHGLCRYIRVNILYHP